MREPSSVLRRPSLHGEPTSRYDDVRTGPVAGIASAAALTMLLD
jgi:hypothetical protein